MQRLKDKGIELVIYDEPSFTEESFDGNKAVDDFDTFKQDTDVIIANRLSDELLDVKDKGLYEGCVQRNKKNLPIESHKVE